MPEGADLIINGRFLDPKHKAVKGNTGYLVPLRLVAENLGAEVDWTPGRGSIVVSKKEKSYEFHVGSTLVLVNGERQNLPELVRSYHGHAFAPAAFIAKALGATLSFSEDTETLALIRQEPALEGQIVVLAAADGNPDCTVTIDGLSEKQLTYDIADRARRFLTAAGAAALVVEQPAEAEGQRPTLLLSVHINSSTDLTLEGIEAYYYSHWQSQRLAGIILAEIAAETRAVNRGVKEASFYLLRHAGCPTCRIECGFLTNAQDRAKLAQPEYREKIAVAIFRGIRSYFETHPGVSVKFW